MKFGLLIVFYSALILGEAIFAQTKRQPTQAASKNESIRFQLVPVRKTGIRFPRLTYCNGAEVLKKVNQQIDKTTVEFGCDKVAPKMGGEYDVKSKVEYATNQVFSIYASASWVCGNAHPINDSNISMTFDLKTGKLVKFEELFKNYEQNKVEILKVVFAAQLERSARLLATEKIDEGSCEGNPNLYSLEHLETDSFAFNFSPEGLRVQPSWPHVIEACSERVTVPYRKLKKFAEPEGLLARVIE